MTKIKTQPKNFKENDLIDAYLTGYNHCFDKKPPEFVKYLKDKHGVDHLTGVTISLRRKLKK